MAFQLGIGLVFAVLVSAAILLGRRGDFHKRFMLLASLSILSPVIVGAPARSRDAHLDRAVLRVDRTGGPARVDLHKRLGIFGAAVALLVVILGAVTIDLAVHLGGNHTPPGMRPALFLANGWVELTIFAGLAGSGLALRQRHPDPHKRLMLLATICCSMRRWRASSACIRTGRSIAAWRATG